MQMRVGLCLAFSACTIAFASNAPRDRWISTWTSAQQIPESYNALPADDLRDATIRQVIRLSIGGKNVRVHLSNAFGTSPLRLTAVHIARAKSPDSSAIVDGSDCPLHFSGVAEITIPAGAEFVSDAAPCPVEDREDLAITMHLETAPSQQTQHPGSRATSYMLHGDQVSASVLVGAKTFEHWTMLSAVDVTASEEATAIVALGDSITDGHGSTINGNDRWTDFLAERLMQGKNPKPVSVLNAGIGGNHLLTDGLGPNALARFDRDVLAPAGAHYVIVLEGVNDLGGQAREANVTGEQRAKLIQSIEAAYTQIVQRGHAHGMVVIGGTILPYVGSDYYHPSTEDEQSRVIVNAWIRDKGHFDAVVDFDKIMADPQHPDRLLPAYDSGDHLHPPPRGYRTIADGIPLSLFR